MLDTGRQTKKEHSTKYGFKKNAYCLIAQQQQQEEYSWLFLFHHSAAGLKEMFDIIL